MTTRDAINAAVKEAYDAGLCVVPPREDGSKAPVGNWKEFQTERPDLDWLRAYYGEERHGLGVVGGPVSGGLEVFELESEEMWKRFRVAMCDGGYEDQLEEVEAGYLERAPRGGVHYLWRTEHPGGNTKLARNSDFETLIETRGAGGFCIIAPSYGPIHPSGRPYERLGGSFATIAKIGQEDRETWLRVARTFNAAPKVDGIPCRPGADPGDDSLPGVDFNNRGDWHEEVLLPARWTHTGTMPDGQGGPQEFWRRPDKDHGNSAVLHPEAGPGGLFVCFSTSTPFETEEGYSKFRVYALLHHGGDFHAAASELKRRGYGQEKKLWIPPPSGGMRGSDVFDLDVPEIQSLPVLKQPGMVMEGGSNLLYAYPKTGKTELLTEVLPEWIEMGKQVLYLTEEPLWFWKPRLRRFKKRARDFWEPAVFVPALGWGILKVYEYLEEAEFDILVVDTLRNTCGFQEGEGDKDVTRVVIPLIALCRDRNATFFPLYHARKMPGEDGRDISGHHSLYGVFDRALQLRRVPGEENETKRRLTLSGRLITPETPAGMTYQMRADGHFESLDVKLMDVCTPKKGDGE